MFNIAEAARSTVPFAALEMTVENLVRHPDASTVEFTVVLKPKDIGWQAADNEKSTTNLMVAAVSLSNRRDILASRLESLTISTNTQDASRLATTLTRLPIRIRVPRKTQDVRVAIQVGDSGRIGTVELDRKMIDAAPESPTPDPKLTTSTERKSPDTGPDLK